MCHPPPPLLSSILCGFPTHSDPRSSASWLAVTEFPLSPVVRLGPSAVVETGPMSPLAPRPCPRPSSPSVPYFFEFADIPFRR